MERKKRHRPYNKFKGFLRENQLTYDDVSKVIDISETAVAHKINGISDFYVSEINKMSEAFNEDMVKFFSE